MSRDLVEDINARLVALLRRLTPDWLEIDTDKIERMDNASLYLLCGAGLVELDLRGSAWTDQAALEFKATVSGVWIDSDRASILPDEVRRAVPAWMNKAVAVQLQPVVQARLTTHGQENKRQVEADLEGAFLFALFVTANPVRGRVAVRLIGKETAAPGVVPNDAVDGGGVQQWLQAMAETQKEMVKAQQDIAATLKNGSRGGPATDAEPVKKQAPRKSKKRGRKVTIDLKLDKQIWDAWGSGLHKNKADVDKALNLPEGTSEAAIDRHRKRRSGSE